MNACPRRNFAKVKPARDLDVLYDPILSLSIDKDYQRELAKASKATLSYVVQPNYDTMFSDSRASYQLIPKQPYNLPTQLEVVGIDRSQKCVNLKHAVTGPNRSIYFKQPVKKPKPVIADLPLKMQTISSATLASSEKDLMACLPLLNKTTQSDFRESETQTDPWTHDVIATTGVQLLQLGWLKIDPNKRLGLKDVCQLVRHWHKQAWDELMPRLRLLKNSERQIITQTLAANDTAGIDNEMEADNVLRISLSAQQMSKKLTKDKMNLDMRLLRFHNYVKGDKLKVVAYLRKQLERQYRRLSFHNRDNKTSRRQQIFISNDAKPIENIENYSMDIKALDNFYQIRELDAIERLVTSSKYFTESKMAIYHNDEKGPCVREKIRAERRIETQKDIKMSDTISEHHRRREIYTETPGVDDGSDLMSENTLHYSLLGRLLQSRAAQVNIAPTSQITV